MYIINMAYKIVKKWVKGHYRKNGKKRIWIKGYYIQVKIWVPNRR